MLVDINEQALRRFLRYYEMLDNTTGETTAEEHRAMMMQAAKACNSVRHVLFDGKIELLPEVVG